MRTREVEEEYERMRKEYKIEDARGTPMSVHERYERKFSEPMGRLRFVCWKHNSNAMEVSNVCCFRRPYVLWSQRALESLTLACFASHYHPDSFAEVRPRFCSPPCCRTYLHYSQAATEGLRNVDTATFQVMDALAAQGEEIRVQIFDLSGHLM